ncbi:MAG: helix-turn-helix domain-containing protein, partial [Pseudorhodoplanes sp.]|nr:helix-turn-helix domain-containing protein [Pseudorhodoplanes sp.]
MDALALGRYLRESREAQEIQLDDVVEQLKIRRAVLESFEQGDFNLASASDIQVRGFLRNYARYLNLEEDKVLQYYTAARYGKPSSKSRRRSKKDTDPIPVAPRRITDTPPSFPAITLAEQR